MTNKWTITLEEDPITGDLIMPIPTDCLNQMGWDIGDTLLWEELGDGAWSLKKKEEDGKQDNSTV